MTKCLICHNGKDLPFWANVHGDCFDEQCHCFTTDDFQGCKLHNKKSQYQKEKEKRK